MSSHQPKWDLDQVFGREKEIARLDDLIGQASSAQATAILHGVAGSGKSSLIRSRPWKEQGWVLGSGKFEQHRTGEPFSAIIQAINDLVEMWMKDTENATDAEKANNCEDYNLSSLLQEDVEFLKNILPKAYLANCPEMLETTSEGTNMKRRSSFGMEDQGSAECVNASLCRILAFMCQHQPLALFIDDIHWADRSSLDALKLFAGGIGARAGHFILVLSYRDEEMNPDNPALATIQEIQAIDRAECRIQDMAVDNLVVDGVNALVSHLTRHSTDDTLRLAQVVHKKTAGNPFFVTQFLQMLRQEDFLTYSFQTFKWEWGDIERLENAASVSDNVADIVARSMERLSESTRVALKVAACLGKIIPVDLLVHYFEFYDDAQSGYTCSLALYQIEMFGLQVVLDEAVTAGVLIKPEGQDRYMWAHDKLQHVAYSLIPDELRASLHIKLGKLLWKLSVSHPGEDWMIFMAADQLNRFSDHKQDQVLGFEVATLCFEAAKLSLSKSALYPAFDMLLAGAKHMDIPDKWTAHYKFTLKLYSNLAELGMSLGKHEEAMDAVEEVEKNANSFQDQFRVQCVRIDSLVSGTDRDYNKGVEKTIEILKGYNVKIPKKLYPGQMFIENQKLKKALPGGKLEGLLDLPEAEDACFLKIIKLVVNHLIKYLGMSSKIDKNVGWYTSTQTLWYSVKYGVCQETAVAVGNLAWQFCSTGHFKEATEHAELAIKLIKNYPVHVGSKHGMVIASAVSGIYSVTKPLNLTLDMYLEGHHTCLKTGDTELAALCILGYVLCYTFVGLPLAPLQSDLVAYGREARQFRMPETVTVLFQIAHQTVLNLREDTQNPTVLKGKAMDEDKVLSKFSGNGLKMTKRDVHTFRLLLANIYGDWDAAEFLVDELEPFVFNDGYKVRASLRSTVVAIASFQIARNGGKKKYRTLAKKILKEVKEDLKRGNVNAHSIYSMLEAESSPSKERYDEAIRSCARLGFVHYEAYMCECAAKFFLEKKDAGWAEYYMAQAYVLYDDWGARGKVNRLKVEYSELLKSSSLREKGTSALKGRTRYSSEHTDNLRDLAWDKISSTTSSTKSSVTGGSDTSSETASSDSTVLRGSTMNSSISGLE